MASAGMPCAAAAAVTSGSLAAPSSIEYSVWTCRWANESVLLTGVRYSSVVVRAQPSGPWDQDDGRRPAGKTGGAGRAVLGRGGRRYRSSHWESSTPRV